MLKEDLKNLKRIDEITSSIKNLYYKLFHLEFDGKKNTTMYNEYISCLKIALRQENIIYNSISRTLVEYLMNADKNSEFKNYGHYEYIKSNILFDEIVRKSNKSLFIYNQKYTKPGEIISKELGDASAYIYANILYEYLFRSSNDSKLKYNMSFKESNAIETILVNDNMELPKDFEFGQSEINWFTNNPKLNSKDQAYLSYYNYSQTEILMNDLITESDAFCEENFTKSIILLKSSIKYLTKEAKEGLISYYESQEEYLDPSVINTFNHLFKHTLKK